MPVYKRCLGCTTDNKLIHRKCRCELTLVDPANFRYKVKLKRNGQWRSKIMPSGASLHDAKKAEALLLFEASRPCAEPSHHASSTSPEQLSFTTYYAHAKLTKKSHLNDLQLYNKYLKANDWQTTTGILSILAEAKGQGRADATIRHIYTLIKRIHNWHIECDLHPSGRNPCKAIKLPRVDNAITNVITEDEARNLLLYLDKHSNRSMAIVVSLAILTGRRQGEILGLLKDDVDLSRRTFTCRQTKSGRTLSFPINDHACNLLKEAISQSAEARVFSYTKNGFQTNWYRLRTRLMKAGVLTKSIRYHDLRHTFATILANKGTISLQTIQKLLGHSTIELTQRYAHLSDKTLRDAVDILG